ncbi:head-tail joining protein [Thalassoroseus pseudoceratinae]|uniref:head-tail joining protein n=1 Tax=Thalassoroseus pseudoceratinae TaxID=2713176 RepID=UPI001422EDBA|nr:hypothetical protein [Thalassoroseus pseudoceratinae]
MANLENIITDARSVILDTDMQAEEVTYTPSGGGGSTITAIVLRHESIGLQVYEDGSMETLQRTVLCSSADVSDIKKGDTFTIGGDVFFVSASPDSDGFGWITVEVERTIGHEKSGSNYRIRRN